MIIEGQLVKNTDGRFYIHGHPSSYFTSGEVLEVNLDGHWMRACMEFNHGLDSYILEVRSGEKFVALIYPYLVWARTIR
jgi:hypothetical protein